MLEKIKTLLGLAGSDKDALLLVLIENTTREVLEYCHLDCISNVEYIICEMVVFKYNLLGTEGLNSESYSGVTFSYLTDYPESIVRQLKKHRRLVTY